MLNIKRLLPCSVKTIIRPIYCRVTSRFKYPKMSGIVLAVTYRCNANCPHCSQSDYRDEEHKMKELTADEIDSLFDELRKFDIRYVNLFGGEPLLREDVVDIVKSGKDKGMTMSLETNAFLLNEEKMIALKKAGLVQMIIGLDYADSLRHDRFKGLRGVHDKAIEAIKLCKRNGIICHISVTATRDTLRMGELRPLFELARGLRVDNVRVMLPIQIGRWRQRADELLSENEYEELKKLTREYSDIALLNCHNKLNVIECGPLVGGSFFINAFADIMPCCLVPLIFGNVREEKVLTILKRMWRHPMFKANPSICWPLSLQYRKNFILPNYQKRLYMKRGRTKLFKNFVNLANSQKDTIISLMRLLRIARKASNGFRHHFFSLNYKSIARKIKNRLLYGASLTNGPKNVCIGVCNECDYRCFFCFEHSPLQLETQKGLFELSQKTNNYLKAKIGLNIFKELIDDLTDLGNRSVCLAGIGEPFLHPDFLQMCRYAKSKGQSLYITSNGSFINEEEAKALVDLGIEELYISIGASNPKTYHSLTGFNSETFEKILNVLKTIKDYKSKKGKIIPKVFITNVICSLNYLEAVEMVKIGLEAGADVVGFHRMYFCGRRKRLIKPFLLNDEQTEELKGIFMEAILLAKKYNLETNIASFLNLTAHLGLRQPIHYQRQSQRITNDCVILADGAVYALDYPKILGNINTTSFINIWYSERYRQLRNRAIEITDTEELFDCSPFCRICNQPLYKTKKLSGALLSTCEGK